MPKTINNKDKFQIDLLLLEKYKKDIKFNIVECKFYEDFYYYDHIENNKMERKINRFRFSLYEDSVNQNENELRQLLIEPLFIVVNQIKVNKEFQNINCISLIDYLNNH